MAIKYLVSAALLAITASAHSEIDLRQQYSKEMALWPAAMTADGVSPLPLAPLRPIGDMDSEAKVSLGEALFNDTLLSRDKSVSCASCHDASILFQDGKTNAVGIKGQVGNRNTPPIFGIDHWNSFFWDGRATTATEQALKPITNPIEMDLSIEEALVRLNNSEQYKEKFNLAFGTDKVNSAMLAAALVAFERTIPAPPTRYQSFIAQAEEDPAAAVASLSDQELRGLHLFRTKAKCMTCHEGALLSDNEFHVTGFHNYGRRFEDLGRVLHTQNPADFGKFRTPSLLGVTQTGPWMHNGLFTQFKPMVMQYNKGGFRPTPSSRGGAQPFFPRTTDLIQPLHLTKQEVEDLVVFLHTL